MCVYSSRTVSSNIYLLREKSLETTSLNDIYKDYDQITPRCKIAKKWWEQAYT